MSNTPLLRDIKPLPPVVALVTAFVVLTAMCLAAAALSYHLFEVHFLRLKRYFAEPAVVDIYPARRPDQA